MNKIDSPTIPVAIAVSSPSNLITSSATTVLKQSDDSSATLPNASQMDGANDHDSLAPGHQLDSLLAFNKDLSNNWHDVVVQKGTQFVVTDYAINSNEVIEIERR